MTLLDDDPILFPVAHHTIGFLKETWSDGVREFAPAGSGVHANVGGIRGAITAEHVLVGLGSANAAIVSPIWPRHKARPLEFSLKEAAPVVVPGGGHKDAEGPDLGFIRFPYRLEQRLIDDNLFYSFDVRLRATQNPLGPLPYELIAGVIGETFISQSAENVTKATFLTSLIYGSISGEHLGRDGLDLFEFHPIHNEHVRRPESYGGLSGAAVWRLGPSMSADDRMLCGIAFHQSDRNEDGARAITCHGPRSLYRNLSTAVRDAFPREFRIEGAEAE